MKIIKTKSYSELSKTAADIVISEILKKPNARIGFASGKTVIGLYKELVKANKSKKVSFSRVNGVNIDEYFPIKKRNKKSFHSFLMKHLYNKADFKKSNLIFLNSETLDPKKECENYEKKVRNLDLLILGVGVNGHITYNEPGSSFKSKTRVVDLDASTRKDPKLPTQALSIGISTILSAKKIILLASGKKKSKAIASLKRKPTEKWPITSLKKHKNTKVIVNQI